MPPVVWQSPSLHAESILHAGGVPRTPLLQGMSVSKLSHGMQGLSDWRNKLNDQVSEYQEKMGALNSDLRAEVNSLRSEFNDLRGTLRQQIDLTVSLANGDKKPDRSSPAVATQSPTT